MNGRATLGVWKLSDFVGTNNNTVIATSGNATTTFTASAIAGSPKKLAFTVHPTSTTVSTAIAPSIVVQVLDSLNNLVTTATNTVTISLSANPGTATLGGSLSVAAVAGVATFTGITLNALGSGYAMQASSGALQSVISNGFDKCRYISRVLFCFRFCHT